MIWYNRPPLNCQKCQFRFFTDQGLERHLLGNHGLVTASMQDAAIKCQDSGRCPVCGKYNEANVAILNTPSFLGVDYAPPTPSPGHTVLKQSQGDKR